MNFKRTFFLIYCITLSVYLFEFKQTCLPIGVFLKKNIGKEFRFFEKVLKRVNKSVRVFADFVFYES